MVDLVDSEKIEEFLRKQEEKLRKKIADGEIK